MNNLNSILIEGNLVKDAETRSTMKGTPVCQFTIAVNSYHKNNPGTEKEVSYFTVETWGKLAETCGNLGRKGRGCRVVGRLKQERWNGIDRKSMSKVIIIADHAEFKPELKKDYVEVSEQEECHTSEEHLVPLF